MVRLSTVLRANRLTDFVNSGGKRLQGLVNRREEFKAWCLSDPALKGAK